VGQKIGVSRANITAPRGRRRMYSKTKNTKKSVNTGILGQKHIAEDEYIYCINLLRYFCGPSDRVRTCGLMVPNHPRYQLRYTRIFTFRFLEISLSVVKAVVKCNFGVHFNGRSNPAIDRVPRASGVSVSHGSDIGTALPNHPRYQLRYTRIFDFFFLEISLSVVIPVVKGDFAVSFRQRRKPINRGAARLSGIGAGHRLGYRRCAPKPPALPTALHPVI
jgi:hypothetical protein